MPQFRDNFHSEEAQEIMGRAPSWVVRWGITVKIGRAVQQECRDRSRVSISYAVFCLKKKKCK